MKTLHSLIAFVVTLATLACASTLAAAPATALPTLVFREVRYDGKVSDDEARFVVDVAVEATGKGDVTEPLFSGELAVLPANLPSGLRLERHTNTYRLVASRPGNYCFKLELVAKIHRTEPWNSITFTGPNAAIAAVNAQATGTGIDLQLLSGTVLDSAATNGAARVKGYLGADQQLALRWQSKAAEVTRAALLTADTTATALITPTVVKFNTQIRYDIVQGRVTRLDLTLPASQLLTRLVGEQVRDWQIKPEGNRQRLTVEFIKPIEKKTELTLLSEQPVELADPLVSLEPPQPTGLQRESGSFTISTEDTHVDVESANGLRQVNTTAGAFAAYRFNARPFALALKLRRIEPVLTTTDRVTTRLEESRLLTTHALGLKVEKAGIYSLEATLPAGVAVAEVKGEGVDDWSSRDGKLRVNFAARVLGTRTLEVQLEQAFKTFPTQVAIAPLRVIGATKETAHIGAAALAGLQLKTAELIGVREIPITQLPSRSDELLAFRAEQSDWNVTLGSERLAARVVSDVFNLVTIGDGLVGGSATMRYVLLNQGVQEFRVKVPANFKNVEFTGPNIRRKEQALPAANATDSIWTVTLQDKAWGAYTLVVTYDYQFDPQAATLPIAGVRALDVERETGSVAITTAASLKLTPKSASGSARRVDETELAAEDRALATRAVLLAWQYASGDYALAVDVKRHEEIPVLSAVADRTQITTVLTEEGEMLTQATFMVKNNDKQSQRFQLPKDAHFWGAQVNGQPVKAERDGEWLLVPLPRGANRDQAFAVDLVYAEKRTALTGGHGQPLALHAPRTDVPNTYAEWQLYVPDSHRLAGFAGSMNIARGTTYEFRDAWNRFLDFYAESVRDIGSGTLISCAVVLLIGLLIVVAVRNGRASLITALVVVAVGAILMSMLLPALSKAKVKASTIKSVSNLKQIGLAMRMFNEDTGRLPNSLEEIATQVGTDKVFNDPQSGERYAFVTVGGNLKDLKPDSVLAYSPVDTGNGRNVLCADGSVQQLTTAQFADIERRGLALRRPAGEVERAEQLGAIRTAQLPAINPSTPGESRTPVPTTAESPLSTASTAAAGTPALNPPPPNGVAGIRSLQIEVPRSGQPFVFTKVLNIRDEPLSVSAEVLPLRALEVGRMIWQVSAFAVGIALMFSQWQRTRRSSFLITLGLVLAGGAVVNLLMAWRLLHTAFITGFPLIALVTLFYVFRKFWPRRKASEAPAPSTLNTDPGLPPVVATIVLLLALAPFNRAIAKGATNPEAHPATMAVESLVACTARASVTILSANYTGSVKDRVAQVDAVLRLRATAKDQTLPLFDNTIVVQQFSAKGGDAKLVRDGNRFAVALARAGDVSVTARLLVKVSGDVTRRDLAFAIPPALTSQFALTVDQPEADVEFPAAISLKRSSDSHQTRLDAVLGSAEHIELHWTPRVKRAAEIAATVFCQNNALVTLGSGVINVRATLDFHVTQGELRQLRVRIPAGHRLLRVDGDGIRTWNAALLTDFNGAAAQANNSPSPRTTPSGRGQIVGNTGANAAFGSPAGEAALESENANAAFPSPRGEGDNDVLNGETAGSPVAAAPFIAQADQVLTVELLKGVSPNYKLTVETEKTLEKLPAIAALDTPHALDVKRETGIVAVRGTDELELTLESASELQRVDTEEFNTASATKTAGLFSAFRFLKPEFGLRVRASAIEPQIEAIVRNAVRVGAEQLTLAATVDYTIKRAGVFALKLALPADWRIERVTSGDAQTRRSQLQQGSPAATKQDLQWFERAENGQRVLEVTLKERVLGSFALNIELAQSLKELPKTLAITGVHPLGARKLSGFVSASAEPGIAVKTATFDGLAEIPVASLPGTSTGAVLAFKHLATEAQATAGWKLAVATEVLEPWIRAEVVNTFTLSETLVSGRAQIRYDIANAPVKELRVTLPAAFTNVEISGANIRRKELAPPAAAGAAVTWTVTLQNKVRGEYILNVAWEQPRDAKVGTAELASLVTEGTERETGAISIVAKAPLQVTEKSTGELQKVDVRDLPAWAGRADDATALAYRYLRPGWKLAVDSKRYDDAEVLQALIESARLTTVVADDGQTMTSATFTVRNNGRQHLEMELPAGATVWSAFVASQPVRPGKKDGKLLLPLESAGAADNAVTVEITYVGTTMFPKGRGALDMVSPKFDAPLKNARWDLFLPPDYTYDQFTGTMRRDSITVGPAGAPKPVRFTSFSLKEYADAEKKSRDVTVSETRADVSNVQKQLALGNYKDAAQTLNRARQRRNFNEPQQDDEFKKLEKGVAQAQGNALITRQQNFFNVNGGALNLNSEANNSGAFGGNLTGNNGIKLNYDNDAAEQQWTKLQVAQEIAVTKVQPLHVNLPTRGQLHSFSQVLQTEVGKPMTIRLVADNAKTVNWWSRGVLSLAGFLALWGLVAITCHRSTPRQS